MLQKQNLPGHILNKPHYDVLVAEEIGTPDGIPGMKLKAIAAIGFHYRRRSALSTDGMGTHQLHLGNNTHIDSGMPRGFNRRSQSGQPGTAYKHIMLLHR